MIDLDYFVDDITLMGVGEWEFDQIKRRANIRVKAILPYINDKVVLDIGCGSGYATNEYSKVAKDITGLDICSDALKFAREHYPYVKFVEQSALEPFYGKYDVIVSTEMMEHLPNEDWDKLLTNVREALNDGGLFVGTIPHEKATDSWEHHKARYDKDVFKTTIAKYFTQGYVSQLIFPWYQPSYLFRFIKEGK
jgi:2-polyprenyl-3-methyl-5-hydroxy-6-metoxy-1,4-benzoquinol methylase